MIISAIKESLYATSMTQADITDDKKTLNEKKRAYSKIMKPVQTQKGSILHCRLSPFLNNSNNLELFITPNKTFNALVAYNHAHLKVGLILFHQ